MVKVNLGCGPNAVVGWVNIDSSLRVLITRFPLLRLPLKILVRMRLVSLNSLTEIPPNLKVRRYDVRKGLPFKDNEIDYIYSSHMIEHLTEDEAKYLLEECFRTLKKGGVIRLVAPDLRYLVQQYLKNKEAGDPAAADKYLWSMGLEGIGDSLPFINRLLGKHHLWVYDSESLAFRLRFTGFSDVEERAAGEGECPDLEQLGELRLHPDSFYLEAKK